MVTISPIPLIVWRAVQAHRLNGSRQAGRAKLLSQQRDGMLHGLRRPMRVCAQELGKTRKSLAFGQAVRNVEIIYLQLIQAL